MMRPDTPVSQWPKRGRFGGPPVASTYGAHPDQRLEVFRPPAHRGRRPSPVALFLHGGAWRGGSARRHRFVGGALARRGFLVVSPDYRKHPETGFRGAVADAAGAVAWIVRHGAGLQADTSRILLVGHSAGAYMAASLALDKDHLGAHGMSRDVVAGFVGLSGLYGDPSRYDLLRPVFEAEDAHERNPTRLAAAADTPPASLLIHGARDSFVALDEATRFASTLAAKGSRVALRVLPKAGHMTPLAALAGPLKWAAPVLSDLTRFWTSVDAP